MDHKGPVVYMFTFPNGKRYIGQTRNFKSRMIAHRKSTKNGCRLVRYAVNKYGWDNIKKEILVYCDEDKMDYFETSFIELYGSLNPGGYNLVSGGHANKHMSENTKKYMSESAKKRDSSVYRKSDDTKNLPRFLLKITTKYMKGYKISKHVNCNSKHFCDSSKSDEENKKDALEFLEKLNNGEVIVAKPIRQLPIGLQKAGKGYRVFWTDSLGKRHIKHFNTGPFTNEQLYEWAVSHLNMLKISDRIDDIKDINSTVKKISENIQNQKKCMDNINDTCDKISISFEEIENQIIKLKNMFND